MAKLVLTQKGKKETISEVEAIRNNLRQALAACDGQTDWRIMTNIRGSLHRLDMVLVAMLIDWSLHPGQEIEVELAETPPEDLPF